MLHDNMWTAPCSHGGWWNVLPESEAIWATSATSLPTFKQSLKYHLQTATSGQSLWHLFNGDFIWKTFLTTSCCLLGLVAKTAALTLQELWDEWRNLHYWIFHIHIWQGLMPFENQWSLFISTRLSCLILSPWAPCVENLVFSFPSQ
jgi:hypothetical protein